ncbi:MAG: hypothetical protein EPN65_16715 [Pandoraea sp.]|uniref:hypothetical protein n=1 Tax=Pandoraea sp. TaxID=1883445 RepID=UPI001209E490|nr:hypothetical protein [Pandoraea sp.]TAM15956.1 MAG: hypothetical protein EPN65_16715 [Pandoraea sp.]
MRTIIAAVLGLTQAMYMTDPTSAAAAPNGDTPDAAVPDQSTATAEAPATASAEAGNENAQAAAAPSSSDGQSASSDAAPASSGDAGEVVAAASSAADTPASDTASSAQDVSTAGDTAGIADEVHTVAINVEDHVEARDRFAGMMAKLHAFEHEAVEDLRADLRAIGELLHLHSVASSTAETTGTYKPSDL